MYIRAGVRTDERHPNCRIGIYANGQQRIWFDGAAYLRAPVGGFYSAPESVVMGGGQRREAIGNADYPSMLGTLNASAVAIPANGRNVLTIAVPGARSGDTVALAMPALEPGLVMEYYRVQSTDSVRVMLANPTAAVISHSGTWTARVARS